MIQSILYETNKLVCPLRPLQDDLHISIRFLDEVMEFDADTMEEKYTICRLLDLVLDAENSGE